MYHKNSEEAVSPVIGVILMVAIALCVEAPVATRTVILAAVIAAFVFGMAGNIKATYIVAATASESVNAAGDDVIAITYHGGQDANKVKSLTAEVDGVAVDPLPASWADNPVVGSAASATGTAGKNHVVVSAVFKDGTSAVILDQYV